MQSIKNLTVSIAPMALLWGVCSVASAIPNYFVSGEWGLVQRAGNDTPVQTIAPYAIEGQYLSDRFVSTGNENTHDLGITGGLYQTLTPRLAVLWGIGLFNMDALSNEGLIYFNNESTPSYSYGYSVNDTRLMATMQLEYTLTPHWLPFITIGAGYSRLSVDQITYQRQPDAQLSTQFPQFQQGSSGYLAYEAGAGIGYRWNASWVSSLEYSRAYLGHATFAPSPDQQNSQTITTGNVIVNRYDFSLRYQF